MIRRALIASYGCTGCHATPGGASFAGAIGSRDGFGQRARVAGRLPNWPKLFIQWLLRPPALDPATARLGLGLCAAAARHVATHHCTLR